MNLHWSAFLASVALDLFLTERIYLYLVVLEYWEAARISRRSYAYAGDMTSKQQQQPFL